MVDSRRAALAAGAVGARKGAYTVSVTNSRVTWRRALAGVAAAFGLAILPHAAAAQSRSADAVEPPAPVEIVIGQGKSQVLELPTPYTDLMIAEPKIADVLPLSSRSVYVVGKAMGSTALTVYGPGKRLIAAVSIVVAPDIEGLKARLHEILPAEREIAVRAANQSIVLSGTVSSPAVLQQVLTLADTYAPAKVVNMLGVEGAQQVMLSVRFVEMERTAAKALRLNAIHNDLSGGNQFSFKTGDTVINAAGSLADTFGAATFFLQSANVEVLFDALEKKGMVKTLAEPTLVALSGDTASFLAGGEFPIPVAQNQNGLTGSATITVEFKQFGIALAFTPTILKDGMVNLVVSPEVSSIDLTNAVVNNGLRIPGIKVRRAKTTIELRDGESFTIAGLLKDIDEKDIRQYPWVGDVPVLGALFRSTSYQREQSELVIVVTPHLVTPRRGPTATPADHYVPPSDFELFLFGAMSGSAASLKPEDRVLMSVDPATGGVDGAYGHVVY